MRWPALRHAGSSRGNAEAGGCDDRPDQAAGDGGWAAPWRSAHQRPRAFGFAPDVTALADRSELADTDFLAILERQAARLGLHMACRKGGRSVLIGPDGSDIEPWREGYPYPQLLRRRPYQIAKQSLQIELLKLQQSVKASGQRLLIVVEGRDATGKGGAIRRFTENLNPRGIRVIALDKPAAHEQGDNYLRRFRPHLPGQGRSCCWTAPGTTGLGSSACWVSAMPMTMTGSCGTPPYSSGCSPTTAST
jgi:Polyphosphate kinase 2 (PPK2)